MRRSAEQASYCCASEGHQGGRRDARTGGSDAAALLVGPPPPGGGSVRGPPLDDPNPIRHSPVPRWERPAAGPGARIRRLPGVERGEGGGSHPAPLLEAAPSQATTLSVHELNYALANLKVGEVMRRDPICVSPEDSMIEVVMLGHEKRIGSFPVVERGHLVGIVTETEIFRAFVAIFATGPGESIICLENLHLRESPGAVSRLAGLIEAQGAPVINLISLPQRRHPGDRLYVRIATRDPAPLLRKLQEAGYALGD